MSPEQLAAVQAGIALGVQLLSIGGQALVAAAAGREHDYEGDLRRALVESKIASRVLFADRRELVDRLNAALAAARPAPPAVVEVAAPSLAIVTVEPAVDVRGVPTEQPR